MTRAMILCAGFGTRLNELTKDTPKCMLRIGEKPILEHTIVHLRGLGIDNIVINLHYLADQITSYLGSGQKLGVNITYSYEDEPLGTAGAVKKVQNILTKSENFLVLYGDIVTNQNYIDLLDFHNAQKNSIGTIILHERNKSNSIVEIDENCKIKKFLERPTEEELKNKRQNWVNSSLYCFNRKLFDYIPNGKSDFPKDIFPNLIEKNALYGFPLNAYRCAIDSPERYFMVKLDYEKGVIFNTEGLDK